MITAAAQKRSLGAFYTPTNLSDLLCSWGIRHLTDQILEPSFGGCGFLTSAVARLRDIGSSTPQEHLYGCDIDPNAFEHLGKTLGELAKEGHFIKGDYLLTEQSSWVGKFDLVIGNPPYVPYQKIDSTVRELAQSRLNALGLKLGQRASLWAYFVGLALSQLKGGGRLAWVLPGSFLQADYAKGLRRFLAARFDRIHAFAVQQRLFLEEGTDEETVVLLADGYRRAVPSITATDIALSICKDIADLRDKIESWTNGEVLQSSDCSSSVSGQISALSREIFEEANQLGECRNLGDFVKVRIGLVTGDNPFFLLTRFRAAELGIPESALTPVLSKFAYFDGLTFDDTDHENVLRDGGRALMVNCEKQGNALPLQAYIDSYPPEKLKSVGTFGKRATWTQPEDGNIPPAFFPVMHHLGPRLILNLTNANCTNTLHRAFFVDGVTVVQAKLLSISLMCTFSQISGEIVGRKYGSGVLKHEPRDAERIRILVPSTAVAAEINSTYKKMDSLLRHGNADSARRLADQFILSKIEFNRKQCWLDQLPKELLAIRRRRVPDRKKVSLNN
jgi:adenine-specific DNA-methyltransferase